MDNSKRTNSTKKYIFSKLPYYWNIGVCTAEAFHSVFNVFLSTFKLGTFDTSERMGASEAVNESISKSKEPKRASH